MPGHRLPDFILFRGLVDETCYTPVGKVRDYSMSEALSNMTDDRRRQKLPLYQRTMRRLRGQSKDIEATPDSLQPRPELECSMFSLVGVGRTSLA